MKPLFKSFEDIEQFLFWIATMQAQVFPQGIHMLQSPEGYCCLGVGAICTIPEEQLIFKLKEGAFTERDYTMINGTVSNGREPKWLSEITEHAHRS